jgi:hypothetical protein
VAKTRRARPAPRAAKKSGSSKSKAAPAKKAKARAKAAKKPKVPAVTRVELKELRKQFAGVLAVLSGRHSSSAATEARLDETRKRVSQWMTDIDDICTPEDQEICGPDMAFPIP